MSEEKHPTIDEITKQVRILTNDIIVIKYCLAKFLGKRGAHKSWLKMAKELDAKGIGPKL